MGDERKVDDYYGVASSAAGDTHYLQPDECTRDVGANFLFL